MTDNLPAIQSDEPSREVEKARTDTDSWVDMMRPVVFLAERVAGTEFVPKSLRNSPPAVAAAILYGREVGLPPMTALSQTHVIEGKPAMSAEAMRAMVLGAGHELVVEETTGAVCRMRARRRGTEHWTSLTWTLDMARAAGVTGKQVWKSYPRQMLQARCTTELVRLVFPDVIHGFRSLEELEDMGAEEQPAAIEAPATRTKVSRAKRTAGASGGAPVGTAAGGEAMAVPTPAPPAAAAPMPPLPGEPGYDDVLPGGQGDVEMASADGSGDGPTTAVVDAGKDSEDPSADVVDPDVEGEPRGRAMSRSQMRMLMASLSGLGVDTEGPERHEVASRILGRPVGSFTELTSRDGSTLIDTLARCKTQADLWALLDAVAEQDGQA